LAVADVGQVCNRCPHKMAHCTRPSSPLQRAGNAANCSLARLSLPITKTRFRKAHAFMLTRKPLLAKLSGLLPITQCESNTALGRRGTELEEPTIGKLRTPGLPKLSGVLLVNSKNAFMARGKAHARSYQNLCMPHAVMWIPIGIKKLPKRWYSTSTHPAACCHVDPSLDQKGGTAQARRANMGIE